MIEDVEFFKPGRVFTDASHGRMRVAAVRGETVILIVHGIEVSDTLRALSLRRAAGAIVEDPVAEIREKLPSELCFAEDRSAVSVQEISKKWRCDPEQVYNVLRKEQTPVINISAGAKDARTHIRIPVGEYYKMTLNRLEIIEEKRRWVWFGNENSAF